MCLFDFSLVRDETLCFIIKSLPKWNDSNECKLVYLKERKKKKNKVDQLDRLDRMIHGPAEGEAMGKSEFPKHPINGNTAASFLPLQTMLRVNVI